MGHFTSKVAPNSKTISPICIPDVIPQPSYYTNYSMTHIEYVKANESWKLILYGTGKHYKNLIELIILLNDNFFIIKFH